MDLRTLLIAVLLSLLVAGRDCRSIVVEDEEARDNIIELSTSEVIRLRGFEVEEHRITVTGGYVLNLIRARNPLLRGQPKKKAILMLHGTFASSKFFVINSVGARPKDHTRINLDLYSSNQLSQMLAADPAANSPVFLGLNLGYDIWLLDRRGSPKSLGHIYADHQPIYNDPSDTFLRRLKTFVSGLFRSTHDGFGAFFKTLLDPRRILALVETSNPKYWNFSLDEQALYDVPGAIDYILAVTGKRRISLLGYSSGGALALMALTARPELADKVSDAQLWAPSMTSRDASRINSFISFGQRFSQSLTGYPGPIPPVKMCPLLRKTLAFQCKSALARQTICSKISDMNGGFGGNQQKLYSPYISEISNSVSAHELSSLIQSIEKGFMHFFDHGDPNLNLQAYGRHKPPIYDVSRIRMPTRLSFWIGNTDNLVTLTDINAILKKLSVPYQLHFINYNGIYFNHFSFNRHKQAAQLAVIPTLKSIEDDW